MFRFTIRDVLWLTVVVALGVAWWIHHTRTQAWWAARVETVQRELTELDYGIHQSPDGTLHIMSIAHPPSILYRAWNPN